MMNFIWEYKKQNQDDIEIISQEFSVPSSIATIMSLKGINTRLKSKDFFFNDFNHLHDPLLMKDMPKAVNRLINAKKNNELVLILGDYDADGTTAASILFLYFKSLNISVEYYIPNREKEGYGVSILAIDYAIKIGASLIITCDCGITAIEEVKYGLKHNINFIITDHHKPKEELPKADAILNPNQIDCDYPFKGLCGAGVAFKFCVAINNKLGKNLDDVLCYTDLTAIATTADVMPVVDENRFIVKEGLKRIVSGTNKGIKALINVSKLNLESLTIGKLGYWFIPKINAAGRLGDAGRAVKLFTTNNPQLANQIALDLENENEKRKSITMQHEHEAQCMIDSNININNKKVIVLYSENWHFGVVGIVASRIKELYNRPTIILTKDKDVYKGSCRSIAGYDILDALNHCSSLLDNYGGHPMAAGLSIQEKNIADFDIKINQYTNNKIPDNLNPVIHIDYELKFSEINNRFLKFLNYLEPFGPGNTKPVFATNKIKNMDDVRLIGANQDTLKFKIKHSNYELDVIGFKMVEHYDKLLSGKDISIAYTIDKNYWGGRQSTQLVLKDIIYSNHG
ncbi:MAG: single-stranded-DNA-specific exonuclease RecJ [Gammaproteobacteria bacterium]|nr:single-stranded-DNA-specific exonuclease RecJ [Gammaproteobacteria bacterium]